MQNLIKKSLPAIELLVSCITLVMQNKIITGGIFFKRSLRILSDEQFPFHLQENLKDLRRINLVENCLTVFSILQVQCI